MNGFVKHSKLKSQFSLSIASYIAKLLAQLWKLVLLLDECAAGHHKTGHFPILTNIIRSQCVLFTIPVINDTSVLILRDTNPKLKLLRNTRTLWRIDVMRETGLTVNSR